MQGILENVKTRILRGGLVIIVLLAGLSIAQSYRIATCPRLLIGAEVEGETVVCGRLSVPESRSDDSEQGNGLELAVMTLKARGENIQNDPIIFLQGGPGGAAIVTIDHWRDIAWRETRDIILIDQRGVGYSEPSLTCPEFYQSLELSQGAKRCRERLLEQGIDLKAYNSRENAADIADLIEALGVKANLFGVSYGTRLALTVMRDHPENIRTVILDSTYPPQAQRMVELGDNFDRALRQVFADCEASNACQTAYPNLQARFEKQILTLNSLPLELPFFGLEFRGDDILNLYFVGMYQDSVIPYLPYSISKLEANDLGTAIGLLAGVKAEDMENGTIGFANIISLFREVFKWIWREVQAEGVFFSVECQEDVAFQRLRDAMLSVDHISESIRGMIEASVQDQFSICKNWRVGRSDKIESQAVNSNLPTLVLAGAFDPITPPRWGALAAETLSQSYFLSFPNAAHGVFASGDCPVGIISAFLEQPLIQPDNSCIADLEVKFYVP